MKLRSGKIKRFGRYSCHNLFWKAATVTAFFGLALAVRLPWLWEVPRFIDELKEVYLGYQIYNGEILPLHNMAHEIGAMHNYILAGIFKLLGPGVYWPRLYVAVTSALSVILIYYLGKRLYNQWAGLLAALFLLTNGMHILVTHMAWSNCTTPFFFILAVLVTVKAEQEKNRMLFLLTGLLWAAALQTHSSVIIYLLVYLLYILTPGFRRETGFSLRDYCQTGIAFTIGYLNMIVFNLTSGGGSIAWIFTKEYTLEKNPSFSSYWENEGKMAIELLRTLSSTYSNYETQLEYLGRPLILLSAVLLVMGIYWSIKNNRRLLVWFMIAGFLTIPWVNERYGFYVVTRYIMPLVLVAILLMAYGIVNFTEQVVKRYPGFRRLGATAGMILLIFAVMQLTYFYQYCERVASTNMSNRLSIQLLKTAATLAKEKNSLILIDRQISLENDPLPILLKLERLPYRVISTANGKGAAAQWQELLYKYKDDQVAVILARETYVSLRKLVPLQDVQQFQNRIILNTRKENQGWNRIFVARLKAGRKERS